jgi:hypothetical protein
MGPQIAKLRGLYYAGRPKARTSVELHGIA